MVEELDNVTEKQASENSAFVEALPGRALERRLRVSRNTLVWWRAKPEFAEWSRAKDPEGIAWMYDVASKRYHPLRYPVG